MRSRGAAGLRARSPHGARPTEGHAVPVLPKPDTTVEVYLAAILAELQALNAALAPAAPIAAPKTPRTRKVDA